jgi:HSP20 family molecular chaperone IbpA
MGFSNKHSVFSDKFVNDILNGSINYDALEPRANVTNSAAGFNIEVELPGFKKTEIQVEAALEGGCQLVIQGGVIAP